MIRELESIVLKRNVPEAGLREGDIGAVVHCYGDGKAFEVEFVTAGGRTAALLTLGPEDIRPIRDSEILHARELATT